jgi:inhibitor of cysteine peptidase
MYVSNENIYLTSTIWNCQEQTVIHRVDISHGALSYEATGLVPGRVMNQFSMDENQGFFRVATTSWQYAPVFAFATTTVSTTPSVSQGPTTNVYVLDMDLRTVGSIEGISPGETFYAARFFGDRAYLVTFQRVDPLFVIDLRDPYHPRVLGQLEITGVSDYLQPYDENHLIGFGKSSVNVTWENAALFQGLKFSLFDVTDPSHPVDMSDYLVGDRGSDSPALTDSHAILFDHNLNLLVVPVEIAQISGNTTYAWEYGTPVWQGAYVFNISPSGGIVFRGGITHLPAGELPSWNNTDHFVNRSLYIGEALYTISPAMVRMNSLTDLSDLGSVSL